MGGEHFLAKRLRVAARKMRPKSPGAFHVKLFLKLKFPAFDPLKAWGIKKADLPRLAVLGGLNAAWLIGNRSGRAGRILSGSRTVPALHARTDSYWRVALLKWLKTLLDKNALSISSAHWSSPFGIGTNSIVRTSFAAIYMLFPTVFKCQVPAASTSYTWEM